MQRSFGVPTREQSCWLSTLQLATIVYAQDGSDLPRGPNTDTTDMCTYISFTDLEELRHCSDTELGVRLQQRPFLAHAVFNWGRHARGRAEDLVQNTVLDYLAQNSKHLLLLYLRERLSPFYGCQNSAPGAEMFDCSRSGPASALWFSAVYGLNKIVALLVEQGADVDEGNEFDHSALHAAATCRHYTATRLLLKGGADVTLRDRFGVPPLVAATAWAGWEDFPQLLLQYDFERQKQSNIVKGALERASLRGHLKTLQVLINKSIDLEARYLGGRGLLHVASFRGSRSCVEYLARTGFDLNMQDEQQRTRLYHATSKGSVDLLNFFLDKDLDVNGQDIDGWTPLLWAAKGGKSRQCRKTPEGGCYQQAF